MSVECCFHQPSYRLTRGEDGKVGMMTDKAQLIKKLEERSEFCKKVGKEYTGFPRYALKASWDIKTDESNIAKEILESNSNPLQGLEKRLEYCKSREEWCRQNHRNEWINGWISRQNEISNVIEQVKEKEEKSTYKLSINIYTGF